MDSQASFLCLASHKPFTIANNGPRSESEVGGGLAGSSAGGGVTVQLGVGVLVGPGGGGRRWAVSPGGVPGGGCIVQPGVGVLVGPGEGGGRRWEVSIRHLVGREVDQD